MSIIIIIGIFLNFKFIIYYYMRVFQIIHVGYIHKYIILIHDMQIWLMKLIYPGIKHKVIY